MLRIPSPGEPVLSHAPSIPMTPTVKHTWQLECWGPGWAWAGCEGASAGWGNVSLVPLKQRAVEVTWVWPDWYADGQVMAPIVVPQTHLRYQVEYGPLDAPTRTLLVRYKERYIRSLAEDIEGYLNANNLRLAYRALKKLRSKSPCRASAIRAADGRLVSNMDGQMARWAEYFGQLFTVDPPIGQLHTTGLQALDGDPSIDETAPSFDEVREALTKLMGGKAAAVCNISAELLKAGCVAMMRGLHAVLTAMWQSNTIPPDWKRGLVVPIWKGKGDPQDCNNYPGITLLSVPGKMAPQLSHLLLKLNSSLKPLLKIPLWFMKGLFSFSSTL
ncbi:hypothetical protein GWK47_014255 [Chionoecetes opilio]|uniref:Uncharacterized protein n=1 Tax=Chionoecetes opilio TaxID=41210 RepID=A0A8J5CKL1_CHIOP|nr:hypothetical protein GWK47_014255 [Chionoecetes opilio]